MPELKNSVHYCSTIPSFMSPSYKRECQEAALDGDDRSSFS